MKTSGLLFIVALGAATLHAESPAQKAPKAVLAEFELELKAKVDPELDCKFFKTVTTSRPEFILEHDDGHLEDIGDGTIEEEDLRLIEQTADCISTSQGEHKVHFCDAVASADGAEFTIYEGGSYPGSLTVALRSDLSFTCGYSANHVTPVRPLEWKITKQTLRLKSDKLDARWRLYGWISVEFEEIDKKTGQKVPLKLEGFIKPVIKSGP